MCSVQDCRCVEFRRICPSRISTAYITVKPRHPIYRAFSTTERYSRATEIERQRARNRGCILPVGRRIHSAGCAEVDDGEPDICAREDHRAYCVPLDGFVLTSPIQAH